MNVVSNLNPRTRVADRASSLFAHAQYPLANSLRYTGDPGLFGPGSVSWRVVGDVSTFIGGIRALLIQAAHPEVVAGVADHSNYASDPLGRLSRTSSYVTATTYGAMKEVDAALAQVRRAHVSVEGRSHRDRPYSASGSVHAAWVHNALADSFLASYEVFGPRSISITDSNAYVREQARLGAMVHAIDLPSDRRELAAWIASHPDVASSPGMLQTVAFLRHPPLPPSVIPAYQVLFGAAASIVPSRLAEILGVRRYAWAQPSGRVLTKMLRWSLGASPSWWLALERTGGKAPEGITFRRPPPTAEFQAEPAAGF